MFGYRMLEYRVFEYSVCVQSAEENIPTYGGGSDRRAVKLLQ